MKYYGWKGNVIDSYFERLDNGYWVEVSYLKYLLLRVCGYIVMTK